MRTYAPLGVTFEHGEGALLFDTQKRQYLDALSGIAVCGLGHAHPAVTATICEQAGRLLHTSNLYTIEKQQVLADKLSQISSLDRVFFANSGAEANEAAIKLARLYGHQQGINNPTIIVMDKSFHGRTMATLTATGNRKVQAGFEPLVQGFVRAPFNDVEAVKNIGDNNSNIIAVMVEPIQGEGGVNIPDDSYLKQLRELCDKKGWLLILDEIQTGMGRTGQWFAFQHHGIAPDIMTLAKALGNGVPVGACLANEKTATAMQPGNHGSTFGGNPLACATAACVIDTIEKEKLVDNARTLGDYFLTGFNRQLADIEGVREIRGKGLMIGIELAIPCSDLVARALDKNLLINVTAGNVIRLLPPLILSLQQADQIIDIVSQLVLSKLHQSVVAA